MKTYGTDPVGQAVEDTYYANNGVRIYSPAGVIGYRPPGGGGVATPEPVGPGVPPQQPAVAPLSQEALRDMRRQAQNRSAVHSTLRGALSGMVVSWLDPEGKCCVDEHDDLVATGTIKAGEHLRRLHAAYARHWKGVLSVWERAPDVFGDERRQWISDAQRRIELQEIGLYVAPISRWGRTLSFSSFRMKNRLFGDPVRVPAPEYRIGIAEYDRRLRGFVYGVYSWGRHAHKRYKDQRLATFRGFDLIHLFMTCPHRAKPL